VGNKNEEVGEQRVNASKAHSGFDNGFLIQMMILLDRTELPLNV
jgi:hypothetical protein